MLHRSHSFIPAAGHDLLLPLYDPLTKLLGAESARRALIEQGHLQNGARALDVGCGTGSLVVMAKQMHPGAELTGLDPDLRALQRASHKAQRAGVVVRFEHGYANRLPYPDHAFDRVFSSLMFHHLRAEDRAATLKEMRRVLAPSGSLHLVDFATPSSGSHRLSSRLFRFDGRTGSPVGTGVVAMLQAAGFIDACEVNHRKLMLQPIVYYRALAAAR